ncbi:LysR family transcriptional regulator [Clostridium sp. Marseille-P2415]|uniref:LysR family transcriptional regulator n=1 Tax=Clostridium sp. Marseille-P2415 TaxID=1805471 RepID=UPI001356445F|nr:LysR family transcriptional regulator [Clostridium sp. Marseille-P2415]
MTKWIDDFLALAEYKNFSTAADSIYISQSALSKHIKAIECELGVPLFIRTNTKAELTDAGNVYLEYALNIRKFTHELRYKLDKVGISSYILHLSIGTIPCLAESGIMKSLIHFQEKCSNYSIEILESDQSQLLKQLSQKEIDVAICRLDLLSDAEYETVSLVTDEMVLICNKDMFPFEQGSEIDLSAFQLKDIYTIAKESDIFRLTKKQLNDIGFKGDLAGTFPRHMMIYSLLTQKGGCAILPKQLANLQMFPQLTYYRIRNAVKTQIGLVKLSPGNENPQLYEKANVLFDFLRNQST